MSISTLQEYTRIAKYAKYLSDLNRRETWKEQVSRVFDMHRKKFEGNDEALGLIEEAELAVQRKEVLGSQRIRRRHHEATTRNTDSFGATMVFG